MSHAFFYPNLDTPIPPADQQRVRYRGGRAVGWTRSTTSAGYVTVQFDGDAHVTTCTWSELEAHHEIGIPDLPFGVVRLPVLFRVREATYG